MNHSERQDHSPYLKNEGPVWKCARLQNMKAHGWKRPFQRTLKTAGNTHLHLFSAEARERPATGGKENERALLAEPNNLPPGERLENITESWTTARQETGSKLGVFWDSVQRLCHYRMWHFKNALFWQQLPTSYDLRSRILEGSLQSRVG